MASVHPAMCGKFGSTKYYIVTMAAKELTEKLVVPSEMDEWEKLSIEERYQREINYRRVKRQIAPYLVSDDDRFFGAFIVSMIRKDEIDFEPVTTIYKGTVPKLYEEAASSFGFLTFDGSELLVPLDGQHRLAALEFAISGKDEKQKPIPNLEPLADVAQDICTVIIIEHDATKSRKIFNKVNRYAKATTKAENLITADDDVIAVIVREDILGEENAIPDVLVNARSNTLAVRAREFTTLSTLYEGTKCVLEDTHGRINTEILPSRVEHSIMKQEAKEFWETVCEKIKHFSDALHDSGDTGDDFRRENRKNYLLGKPVAQWALVQAIVRLRNEDEVSGSRVSLEEACRRANLLDWASQEPRWQHVLMNGEKVVSGKTAVNFASQVIAYWLGEELDEDQISELRKRYKELGATGQLPEPLEV